MLDELTASGPSPLRAAAALPTLPGYSGPETALLNPTNNPSAIGITADSKAVTELHPLQNQSLAPAIVQASSLANLNLDLLTPALLPISSDPLLTSGAHDTLTQAWDKAADQLTNFLRGDWQADMRLAFGDSWHPDQAYQLLNEILSGQTRPQLAVLPVATLQAQGAFSAASNTLFLAQELLQTNSLSSLTDVLLEELGHFIDSQLNPVDSPGDEGAIFAALVQQQPLIPTALQQLKLEDDTAMLTWQGQSYAVEQAALEPGVLTVNSSGQVSVQYVFDS
ncbi:MAG TPA: hypothetical protein V6D06_00995, partial [Trichocoleus sp.]